MKKFNMLAPISIMVAGIVFSSVIALYACNKAAFGTDPGKASVQGGCKISFDCTTTSAYTDPPPSKVDAPDALCGSSAV